MKKYFLSILILSFMTCLSVQAQTVPALYNQTGDTVSAYDSETEALIPGWYYDEVGNPRYYYANGVYYDPATQSYGGSPAFPEADGPQTLLFTPGVPNTGVGRHAIYAWASLILSGIAGVAGANYLTRTRKSS